MDGKRKKRYSIIVGGLDYGQGEWGSDIHSAVKLNRVTVGQSFLAQPASPGSCGNKIGEGSIYLCNLEERWHKNMTNYSFLL